jgi:ribosomal protein L3 glutamine methyltransferase
MSHHGNSVRPAERKLPGVEAAIYELRTLRDCLRYACSRFHADKIVFGQGTDNAWDEATWLALWALHLPPNELEPYLDAHLTEIERRTLLHLIDRRCQERVPAAYLTGEAWLRGQRFRADPRAIIPRSLIVEALQVSLDDWLTDEAPRRVLDLCTGGASIAISAALRYETAQVDAVDLSSDALELAGLNIADYLLADRIQLLQGDLFNPVSDRQYDLILCNPPYVNANSMAALPPEFLFEPNAALAGGVDGMDLVRRILLDAPAHLTAQGLLLLEIGHEASHFETAFPQLEFAYLPVSAAEDQLVLLTREQLSNLKTADPEESASSHR